MANDSNAVFTTYPRDAHLMPQWQKLMPPARTRDVGSGFTVRSVDVVRNTSLYPYDPNIVYFPPTVPVVCSGKFLGDDMGRMAKFNAHSMLANKLRPVLAPYFAAGFAFMPARAVRVCRYDVHTPMLFDGEELSFAARLFTHGFNLYAPPTDTVYHKYETGENPKYWQVDWNARYYVQLRSSRRIAAVLSGTEPPPAALLDYRRERVSPLRPGQSAHNRTVHGVLGRRHSEQVVSLGVRARSTPAVSAAMCSACLCDRRSDFTI
jgi:hypothetical protein